MIRGCQATDLQWKTETVFAETHLAWARTQNSRTGILGVHEMIKGSYFWSCPLKLNKPLLLYLCKVIRYNKYIIDKKYLFGDGTMKKKIVNIIGILLILVGIGVMLYPKFTERQAQKESSDLLQEAYDKMDPDCQDPDLVAVDGTTNKNDAVAADEYSNLVLEMENEIEASGNISIEEKREQLIKKQKVYGIIEIPDIDVNFVIVIGTEQSNLRCAIGHMIGTAHIGQKGNCVLAGHRGGIYGSFFKHIDQLENGAEVKVINMRKETYTYEVYDRFIVSPDDMSVTADIDNETTLTLISCEDNGATRLIVRCRLKR